MKFERTSNNRRAVVFEFDRKTEMHERNVALNALGVMTAKNRLKPDRRSLPANLGVRLAILETFTPNETIGKPPIFKDTAPVAFTRNNAMVLSPALVNYINETSVALDSLVNMDPHRCSVRAVETEMAHQMLSLLHDEFRLRPPQHQEFGFR